MRLSVPGNLLLLGEYAVLEEGGIGLAAAAERRVVITVRPADALEVRGSWPGGSFRWTRAEPSSSLLVTSVVRTLDEANALGEHPAARVCINIDSSAFFDSAGRKTGLGSSAAVAAALTAALLAAVGGTPPSPAAAGLALRAHRAAQGGRGSGYDVLCSWHGGTGVFRGGETPSWEPCRLGQDFRLLLFPGPTPVQTPQAVMRYAAWKKGSPSRDRDFLEESNGRVLAFLSAAGVAESVARWGECRELGIRLGEAIGVPARITPPPGLDPAWCKAIGAGNELGVCLVPLGAPAGHPARQPPTAAPAGSPPAPLALPIDISAEGLRWEA